VDQRSDEWFAARCGRITASRFKSVLAKTKSGASASRETYKWQIVAERLTGKVAESYTNSAMRWGTEQEAYALAAYEWQTDKTVATAGFIPMGDYAGCSPDGLFGETQGLEIKCPFNSAVHLQTIDSNKMPAEHKPQVQGCMIVTERTSWDFVSFDPRMPQNLKLFVTTVELDLDYVDQLKVSIEQFNDECAELIAKLNPT